MPQTSKAITASQFVEVRTGENGDKFLVLLVTYADATQERIVFTVETVMKPA